MQSMGIDENGRYSEECTSNTPRHEPPAKEFRVEMQRASEQYKLKYTPKVSTTAEYAKYINPNDEIYIPNISVHVAVFVNPCSYEAVAVALRNLGQKFGLRRYGGERLWLSVACDGLPYNLASRLIRSMHICSICQDSINGLDACAQHSNDNHPDSEIQ